MVTKETAGSAFLLNSSVDPGTELKMMGPGGGRRDHSEGQFRGPPSGDTISNQKSGFSQSLRHKNAIAETAGARLAVPESS